MINPVSKQSPTAENLISVDAKSKNYDLSKIKDPKHAKTLNKIKNLITDIKNANSGNALQIGKSAGESSVELKNSIEKLEGETKGIKGFFIQIMRYFKPNLKAERQETLEYMKDFLSIVTKEIKTASENLNSPKDLKNTQFDDNHSQTDTASISSDNSSRRSSFSESSSETTTEKLQENENKNESVDLPSTHSTTLANREEIAPNAFVPPETRPTSPFAKSGLLAQIQRGMQKKEDSEVKEESRIENPPSQNPPITRPPNPFGASLLAQIQSGGKDRTPVNSAPIQSHEENIPTPKPSPEESHNKRQQIMLKEAMEKRANPDSFYIISPPKNQRELEKHQKSLEKDIETYEKLSPLLPKINADQITTEISKKKTELANINEQLKGEKKPIRTIPSDKPLFNEKMSKYTNDELKLLIGLRFSGEIPVQESPLHQDFERYNEGGMLTRIFQDWERLSSTPAGQAMLEHKDEWSRYMGITIFATMETLAQRELPVTDKNHLKEPEYKAKPYVAPKVVIGAKKTMTGASPEKNAFLSGISSRPPLGAGLLQGIQAKNKEAPVETSSSQPPTAARNSLLSDIQAGKSLKKQPTSAPKASTPVDTEKTEESVPTKPLTAIDKMLLRRARLAPEERSEESDDGDWSSNETS